jgi:hypothetical protein
VSCVQERVVGEKYANLDVKYNNFVLHIEDHGGYESRNKSMINLLRDAWYAHIKRDSPPEPNRFFTIYTDDNFNPLTHFSFACPGPELEHRVMPNFIFDSWPECGISDYQSVFDDMASLGSAPPDDDRAFWIGTVFQRSLYPWCPREIGVEVARRRPDLLEFRHIQWTERGLDQFKHTAGYVTMPDHCRHRVLVDFGGIGFSARLPLLLASGRPVVIVGRPQESWFFWDGSLVPWTHYIPCGGKTGESASAESLEAALDWASNNRLESAAIGERGRDYALRHLTRKSAVDRIGSMMDSFCRPMWPSVEKKPRS